MAKILLLTILLAIPAAAGSAENISLIRMPYKVGNRTYNGLRIEHATELDKSVSVYDVDSGVLLSGSSSTATRDGRTRQSTMSLVGIRILALPWLGFQTNPLTSVFVGFTGQGNYLISVANAPPAVLGISVQGRVTLRGKNWLAYRQTSLVRSMSGTPPVPDTIVVANGPGQIGGLLLPAGSMQNLTQGTALDIDEVTGARFFVASSGPGVWSSPRNSRPFRCGGRTIQEVSASGWSRIREVSRRSGSMCRSGMIEAGSSPSRGIPIGKKPPVFYLRLFQKSDDFKKATVDVSTFHTISCGKHEMV